MRVYSDSLIAAPAGPPENFQTTQTTPTSVFLSWDQPTVPNGNITSYTLTYNKTQEPVSVNLSDGVYTVTGLEEYSYYEFVILASTRVGPGPPISIVIQTEQSSKLGFH